MLEMRRLHFTTALTLSVLHKAEKGDLASEGNVSLVAKVEDVNEELDCDSELGKK